MMNTTTDETRSKRNLRFAWGFAIALHVIGLIVFINNKELRTDSLTFNRDEVDRQVATVDKRAQKREAMEKQRREKILLREKDAEMLSQKEEKKRRNELLKRVEEIKENYEQVKELEQAKIDLLCEDTLEKFTKSHAKKLDELTNLIRNRSDKLKAVTKKSEDLEALTKKIEENSTKSLVARTDIKEYRKAEVPDEALRQKAVEGAEEMLNDAKELVQAAEKQIPESTPQLQSLKKYVDRLEELSDETALAALDDEALVQALAKAPPPVDDHEIMQQAENLEKLSADQLYDTAVQLEKKMAERFENARVAELAATTNRDFEEASELVADLSETSRPDLGNAIREKKVNTVGELNEFRETLDKAVSETENIRARAQNRLRQLDPNATSDTPGAEAQGRDINASELARQKSLMQSIRQVNGRSVDLTALMHGSGSAESSKQGEAVLGDGDSNTRGVVKLPEPKLTESTVVARALPGRRFTDASTRQGWLYIDTWYVIGPWDLKEYESKPLPPETEIDLDAVYTNGKVGNLRRARTSRERFQADGTLRWQFHQSDKLFVRPPNETGNAIYYAYTELHFDQDRDILLAIGIDDASKVWINDDIIWNHRVNSWKIGTSLRKVTFKKGYNTVLIRMENGGPLMDFSLVLCPPGALELEKN
jgi:hypothetical protein